VVVVVKVLEQSVKGVLVVPKKTHGGCVVSLDGVYDGLSVAFLSGPVTDIHHVCTGGQLVAD
jgi:hypothetical protein